MHYQNHVLLYVQAIIKPQTSANELVYLSIQQTSMSVYCVSDTMISSEQYKVE